MRISKILAILIVFTVLAGGFSAYVAVTNGRYETVEYTVKTDRLPNAFDGFKVAQVSDLHSKAWDGLTDEIAAAKPDAIIISGDLVNCFDDELPTDTVKALVAIAPTYFATGNHEASNPTYFKEFREQLAELGVVVLENDSVTVERGEDSIRIAGIIDPSTHAAYDASFDDMREFTEEELAETVDGSDEFTVLIAHRPEYHMLYDAHGADVVFSGHAHGGALRLPLIGAVWAPGQGLFPKYDGGVYENDYSTMVVSRGLWKSSEPFRVNCPYELVICTLTQG